MAENIEKSEPLVCGLFSARRQVMLRVWDNVRKLVAEGKEPELGEFGNLVRSAWRVQKEVCAKKVAEVIKA